MKSKQLNPKYFRPSSTNKSTNLINKQRIRCSLCDSLLKASTSHRYLLVGKSVRDNLDEDTTYNDCCQKLLNNSYDPNKLHMICPKCCENLQKLNSLQKDAQQLTNKLRHTWCKTKRLNRARRGRLTSSTAQENSPSSPLPTIADDDEITITVKEEFDIENIPTNLPKLVDQSPIVVSETVATNTTYNLPEPCLINKITLKSNRSHQSNGHSQVELISPNTKFHAAKHLQPKATSAKTYASRKSHLLDACPVYSSKKLSHPTTKSNSNSFFPTVLYHQQTNKDANSDYGQFAIDRPPSSSSSASSPSTTAHHKTVLVNSISEQTLLQKNSDPSLDDEHSYSPQTNDDDTASLNGAKPARLSRRQYIFLVKLPDQQSLNAFIETSSAESGSRWTWRRTSANSRGYKVYYVCNFSMRRHYHPCPAAMYALFHPEGNISIYSCGQHQHIPKDRIPVSITDETKEEIFRCLQSGMTTSDIREHLMRHQLPFGDARKLNNFIKYHKELLRFGTVTNVRIGGTAYRQPQCWAIRRQQSQGPENTTNDNNESTTPS